MADGLATYAPDPRDRLIQVITLTAEGNTPLAEMEAEFERWSSQLGHKLGKENVLQTIEHLRELKAVLDADADTEHLKAAKQRHTEI